MNRTLNQQHVVITGGQGGLGPAVVRAFVEAGATCHLPTHGDAAGAGPGVVVTGPVDLADEQAVEAYYGSLPPIAASVHLAGGFQAKPITETTRADLEQQLRVNVVTAFLCCREAVKLMRKSGGGRPR
jgi:NAD(P)-dependent dehydrogenase (short-subunit alcohol dehydrogenase family)